MKPRSAKLNFLLICADQLRADSLGSYGNAVCRTPGLDRLAAGGTRFSRAYTTCPLCSPARASMYTGQYAFKHGMGTNCDMYHSLATELADPGKLLHYRLRDAGYRCGYQGKWHIGTKLGPGYYGFEGMDVPGYGDYRNEPGFLGYLKDRGLSYTLRDRIYYNPGEKTMAAAVWDGPEESTPEHYLADRTIDMIRNFASASEARPFFISCHFWGPHMPHLPPASFAGTHQRSSIEPWASFSDSLEGKPAIVRRQRRDFYRNLPGSWDKWREIIGLYYDFTSYIDKEIGRILAALEEAGLDGNTVVIFTADHGDMQGCHNESVDKGFLYQEAVRIPLVFRGPGIPAGKVTDDFAYNMDILPTILDLAGSETRSETGSGIVTSAEPAAEKRDGKSLVPVLAGEGSVRENVYLEFHGLRFLYSQRALIDGEGRKYILSAGDFDEVYDLGKDPAELHNLIDDPGSSDIVEELRTAMMKEALAAGDPIVDYIYKIFGTWDNPSGRVWIPETVPTQQEQEGR